MRIYVSSTSLDLQDYRPEVLAAIEALGHEPVAMEGYVADDCAPVDKCLRDVASCQMYVGIFAWRYGHIPPGRTLSITEREFRKAAQEEIKTLIFLLDEDVPWPPKFIDQGEAGKRLKALREKFKERKLCSYFSDPADLKAKVSKAISQALATMDNGSGGAAESAVSSLIPWDFSAFLKEKRQHFCGRDWLFSELDAWRSTNQERALLITGDPGTGKSAIVAELVHRNPGGQVLAYHCCQADTGATLFPGRFVRGLAAMIARRLPEYAARVAEPAIFRALSEESCAQDPASSFEAGVLTPLQGLPAPQEAVHYILVDALDEALAFREGTLRSTIVDVLATRLNRLPSWLRVVATTRKDRAVLDRLRDLRAREIDAQDPRNLRDIERYVRQRLAEPALAERLRASRQGADMVQRLLREKSAGNFLYVQQALQGIERDLYDFNHLEFLPPGLSGLYLSFFQRHFPGREDYVEARLILEVVVAAQEPLTEEELARASGLDLDEDLPRVLRRLSSYLPRRDGRYTLYHTSLADWLTEEDQRGTLHHISRQRGHERLADLGWSEFQRPERPMSRYSLLHLPAHLRHRERLDDLAELLCDLRFLEAKAAAGLVFSLVGDFATAIEHLPPGHPRRKILRLLDEAIRTDVHFLDRHPQALFQCLWNRCWWYDCPMAARHYDAPEGGWPAAGAPWDQKGSRLSQLLEAWRTLKEQATPGFRWLRSLRPPELYLGTGQRAVFRGPVEAVTRVAFSADGQRILARSANRSVWVWDAANGAQRTCLTGLEDTVWSVGFSPDGQRLLLLSRDNTVRILDAAGGASLAGLHGHEQPVSGFAFAPDGRRLATASWDGTVRVWDAFQGTALACCRGHQGLVNSVDFSPDGQRLVSGSDDRTVRIWNADSGAQLLGLHGHDDVVWSVAFSRDGRLIVSESEDKTSQIWETATGARLARLQGNDVKEAVFFPDGRRLLSLAQDQTLRIWDAARGSSLACLRGHRDLVGCFALSPDGRRIASGSRDGTVRVWDAGHGGELACFQGHQAEVSSVAFSPDGQRVVSGSKDQTVRLWDAGSVIQRASLRGHGDLVRHLAFSPDGQRLLSGSNDLTLRLWDVASGVEDRTFQDFAKGITSLAFSPDGQRLAIGIRDTTVRLRDTASGAELACLQGHGDDVLCLAFSPDGRRLASGSCTDDRSIRVWDVASGAELACLRGHEQLVASLAFSADGKFLATGGGKGDESVRVWNLLTGQERACFQGHKDEVMSVAFSADDQRVVSSSPDQTIRVWDLAMGAGVEVLDGSGDAHAFAAAKNWRAIVRGLESMIVSDGSLEAVAWFPAALEHLATHPSGQTWAGAVGNHLYLFTLELSEPRP